MSNAEKSAWPSLAEKFAALMDANRYEEAGLMMSEDCCYFVRSETIRGAEKIVASYSENYKKGLNKLDEIQFFSQIVPVDPSTFKLCYLDRIRKGAIWHEHRCEQVIKFQDDKVVEIRHFDLPGEVESLQKFFARVGL